MVLSFYGAAMNATKTAKRAQKQPSGIALSLSESLLVNVSLVYSTASKNVIWQYFLLDLVALM